MLSSGFHADFTPALDNKCPQRSSTRSRRTKEVNPLRKLSPRVQLFVVVLVAVASALAIGGNPWGP